MAKSKSVWRRVIVNLRTNVGTLLLRYGGILSGMPSARIVYQDDEHGLLMIMMSSHLFDIPNVNVERAMSEPPTGGKVSMLVN